LTSAVGGGTYNPLDPTDGDPGGGAFLFSPPQVQAALLAAGTSPASTAEIMRSDEAVEILGAALSLGAHLAPAGAPQPITTASGTVVGFCQVIGSVFTVVHTRKTAGAIWFDECTQQAIFTDTWGWQSTDSGENFDGGSGTNLPDPKDIFFDGGTTTGGRRGHRRLILVWSANTASGVVGGTAAFIGRPV
jgi:hypothetical protein